MPTRRNRRNGNGYSEEIGNLIGQMEAMNKNFDNMNTSLNTFQTAVNTFMTASQTDRGVMHEQIKATQKSIADHVAGHVRFTGWTLTGVGLVVAIMELAFMILKGH